MKHSLILSLLLLSSTCPAFSAHARQVAAGDGCSIKLAKLVVTASNFENPFKEKIEAEINPDKEQSYTIELFVSDSGENTRNTVGWVKLDLATQTLTDITYDPDEGVILSYNKELYDNYLTECLQVKKPDGNAGVQPSGPSRPQLPYNTTSDPTCVTYEWLSESKIVPSDNPENSCYAEDGKIRYIPMPMKGEYTVILVPHDGGDYPYRYVLHTLKGNKEIDALYVEGEWWEPESDDVQKTSFTIDTDYTITVSTASAEGTSVEVYRINEKGEFVSRSLQRIK